MKKDIDKLHKGIVIFCINSIEMNSNSESTYVKIAYYLSNKKETDLDHERLVTHVERINQTTQKNSNQIFDLETDVNLKADQSEVRLALVS